MGIKNLNFSPNRPHAPLPLKWQFSPQNFAFMDNNFRRRKNFLAVKIQVGKRPLRKAVTPMHPLQQLMIHERPN